MIASAKTGNSNGEMNYGIDKSRFYLFCYDWNNNQNKPTYHFAVPAEFIPKIMENSKNLAAEDKIRSVSIQT